MPETTASEFFGMDFGGSKPVVTQAAPAPAPAVPNPSEKGMIQSAMDFFGIDFATKEKPKPAPVLPVDTTTQGDWNQIDNKYRAGQGDRNKSQLTLLQGELAQERDPSRIEILKREIGRAQKTVGVSVDRKMGDSGVSSPKKTVSDEYVSNMLSAAKKNPEFKEMQDFLGEDFPKVNTRYLGDSVSGQFSTNVDSGGPLAKQGEIDVGFSGLDYKKLSVNDSGMNTLIHETAHATDRKIRQLANSLEGKTDLTPTQKQFLDSYSKLNKFDWSLGEYNDDRKGGQSGIANAVKTLAPSWFNSNSNYRASSRELVGFGVGNASVPTGANKESTPGHIDPTVATMFMLILDQAKRVQKELKK